MRRRDATLRELVHALRLTVPHTAEFRHPLARYTFRALFLDAVNSRGGAVRYATKELGSVSAREMGEAALAPDEKLDADAPPFAYDREKERGADRTLEELKFYPGDLLAVALFLPKPREPPAPSSLAPPNGAKWNAAPPIPPPGPASRGGGHWRGAAPGRGGPPARGGDADRREPPPRRGSPPRRPISPPPVRRGISPPPRRSPPPPRRGSPPPRRGGPPGGRGRGGGGFDRDRRDGGRPPIDRDRDLDRRSRSRSRSPPRRRRYD